MLCVICDEASVTCNLGRDRGFGICWSGEGGA